MKKTAIASVALAATLFAVSCQKENTPVQNESGQMTISAVSEGLNSPTKTELAFKYDVLWSGTDRIYVKDASGNKDTFSLEDGAGTTKGTFTQEGHASFTGEVQAYYPATMLEGSSPLWPALQTNDQTIPMYCKKTLSGTTDERMDFASLGSVLQIVFNTTQAGVTLKSIEIKDEKKTMSGKFYVDENGMAKIYATDKAGITLDLGAGKALGKGANYFNIAVPAGDYQDLTLVFTATGRTTCTITKGKVNIAHNTVGRLTLTGETFRPEGALPGEFSVSAEKTVHFSKGNLYYDGSKFNFEANQYDFRTYAGKNSCINGASSTTSTPSLHYGLFGWVGASSSFKGVAQYGVSTSTTASDYGNIPYEGLKSDWGDTFDNSGTWRTLSTDEWEYLFNNHVTVWGQCKSVNGYFIAPDGFVGDASTLSTLVSDWKAAEAAGIVFLPAAGSRSGSDVSHGGDYGTYWSSTVYDVNRACYVSFSSSFLYPDHYGSRSEGHSVRLITESK